MLTKIMGGAAVAATLALAIVFNLLLNEKEAVGQLRSDITRVEDANQRQVLARQALAARTDEILAQVSAERDAALRASQALIEARQQHETEKTALQLRLNNALENLTDEEIICAMEPVPADLIRGLHADQGNR